MAAFEVAAADAELADGIMVAEPGVTLSVADADTLELMSRETDVEEMTGGSDEAEGIPRVLRIGSRVPVLAVASGPTVKGRSKMAHSSATAEKVAARSSVNAIVVLRGQLELQRVTVSSRLTRFLCLIASFIYTVIHAVDVHLVPT